MLVHVKSRILIKLEGKTRSELGGTVENETREHKSEPRDFPLKSLKPVSDMSKHRGH